MLKESKGKVSKIQQGFTIIEVVIVLVIAVIIMLLVFLVVPQLNRSSRNTKAKTVANNALAAAEQVAANSGGVYPTTGTEIQNITGQQKNGSNVVYTYDSAAPVNNNDFSKIYIIAAGTCVNNAVTAYTGGVGFLIAVAQENAVTNSIWCVSSR